MEHSKIEACWLSSAGVQVSASVNLFFTDSEISYYYFLAYTLSVKFRFATDMEMFSKLFTVASTLSVENRLLVPAMYPLYILNTVMKNRMTTIPIAIMRCVTPSPKRAFLVEVKSASPMRGNRGGK